MTNKTVKIFVYLPEEGYAARPTLAEELGNGLYKILPIPDYSVADEVWEFPPGSIVHLEKRNDGKEDYWLAVK